LNIFQIKITRKDFVGYFSVITKAKRTKIINLSTRFVRVAEVLVFILSGVTLRQKLAKR